MRRVFVEKLRSGLILLSSSESHHLRDVLRLGVGDPVELFDSTGHEAIGRIEIIERRGLSVQVTQMVLPAARPQCRRICVASAVPKGDRADWLVEKLSEIGVERWVPLRTARSVVHPEGTAKFDRWRRHAVEAAKQSQRVGVMTVDALTELDSFLAATPTGKVVLSTRSGIGPMSAALDGRQTLVWLMIGPEGGWTDDEVERMRSAGATEAALSSTVLRIETAAILAAGIAITRPDTIVDGSEIDSSTRS